MQDGVKSCNNPRAKSILDRMLEAPSSSYIHSSCLSKVGGSPEEPPGRDEQELQDPDHEASRVDHDCARQVTCQAAFPGKVCNLLLLPEIRVRYVMLVNQTFH